MPVPTVSPVKNNHIPSFKGGFISSVQNCNATCNPVQEAESVVLALKPVPDLSTFILWACKILFDLISIPTWHFGTGNLDVELLNRKYVRCTVVTTTSF